MGHHADAVATMSAEIEYQPTIVAEALVGAVDGIEEAAAYIRRGNAAAIPSFGVGDSDLVGRLAAACEPSGAGRLHPVSAVMAADAPRPGSVALGQSIGGSTQATLAACAQWQRRGGVVVGITGEPRSALARRAELPVVLEIPRSPPDAKVPGTVTVTAPLAAVWALLDAAGGVPVAETAHRMGRSLRSAQEAARADLDARGGVPGVLPRVVHVVAEREMRAVGAYAEAKLAEAVGVTAVRADPESWLHVQKHAVYPGTLVLALPFCEASPLFQAITRETERRGGTFLPSSAIPCLEEGAPLGITLSPLRPLTLEALLRAICFVQWVALRMLEGAPDRVPYQLGRLTPAEVRGLNPREYTPAPTE